MKKQKNITFLGIITLILLLSALAWFTSPPTKEVERTVTRSEEVEHFTSESLELSFEAKTPVIMKDMLTGIILDYDGKEIVISRSTSDYKPIDEYLEGLIYSNKLNVKARKNITIDGSSGVILFTDSMNTDHPTYFVIKNEWIYSMYTIHPELFDDLDHIVKSFKYEGEKTAD